MASIQAQYSTCEESQQAAAVALAMSNAAAAAVVSNSSNVASGNPGNNGSDVSPSSSTIDSPRRRRTGLHTVMEKPPEIDPEIVQEVENRMRAQTSGQPSGSGQNPGPPTPAQTSQQQSQPPKSSPNKHSSLRARRTGLSTVMEVKSSPPSGGVPGLIPGALDRISPLPRRSSDCCHSSSDASPCCDAVFQVTMMQEEAAAARLAQNEGGASSADSASSGYMSPHFLRPPSPDDLHMQPRRSSDSGVDLPVSGGCVSGVSHDNSGLRNSASVPSQAIQQIYDEMYMDPSSPAVTLNNSRRYSYPNSPVHGQLTASASAVSALSHYIPTTDLRHQQNSPNLDPRILQQLRIQHHKIEEEEPSQFGVGNTPRSPLAYKGSITQGVPAATSPTPTIGPMSSLATPVPQMPHSASFDEAFDTGPSRKTPLRGCSGSASNLWHFSTMEDSDVDYMTLPYTPDTGSITPRPSLLPAGLSIDSACNPEICVTNATGDEIKFVFGQQLQNQQVLSEAVEPMDHS